MIPLKCWWVWLQISSCFLLNWKITEYFGLPGGPPRTHNCGPSASCPLPAIHASPGTRTRTCGISVRPHPSAEELCQGVCYLPHVSFHVHLKCFQIHFHMRVSGRFSCHFDVGLGPTSFIHTCWNECVLFVIKMI